MRLVVWGLAVVLVVLWAQFDCVVVEAGPVKDGEVVFKESKPCLDHVQTASQQDSNRTEEQVNATSCDTESPLSIEDILPEKRRPMTTEEEDIADDQSSENEGIESFTENSPQPRPKKEDLSGGKTGVSSNEFLEQSEFEEEKDNVDSLAPHAPYPEMVGGTGAGGPATTEATPRAREPGLQDIATNKHFPDENKSKLFVDSGIFPFIAMGVLSVLFITMMIAALYFARHSSEVHQHNQMGMKNIDIRSSPLSRDGDSSFHAVTFRNVKDAVIGDFAVNMFAVRQVEREEAKRELAEASESTILDNPANISFPRVTREPVYLETAQRFAVPLRHRDLPDVVSGPSSRKDTMSHNRHSTGSSLYMELMNMCRNTRLLEELALRRKNIRMQDATQLDQDDMFSSDIDYKSGKLVLRCQNSLDSARCRENVPLPCTYESQYFKLYDDDDDDSSVMASASANTTMDTMLSGDEGCTSTLSSLHRKGSSKRNSRLLDESRQLLPVLEFFNSSDGEGAEDDNALYETIDEMGYRRRTASSRAIRHLMEARENAGQAGETVVVENAWESSPKKYDKIDRSIKAYRKQTVKDKDYNQLVV